MGRNRNPQAANRRHRYIAERLEREARKDDVARQLTRVPHVSGSILDDPVADAWHWGTDPGHGGLTKHRDEHTDCASPDADRCLPGDE